MSVTYEDRLRVCGYVAQGQPIEFIAYAMGTTPKQLKADYAFELAHGGEITRAGLFVRVLESALGGDPGLLKRVQKQLGPPPTNWADLQFANQEGEAHFRKGDGLYLRTGEPGAYQYELIRGDPDSTPTYGKRARRSRTSPGIGYPHGETRTRGRGRPRKPTPEEKQRVMLYAASDASDEVIAYLMNMHPDALRSRFAYELRFGKNWITAKLFWTDLKLAAGGSGPAAERAFAAMGEPKRRAPFREVDEMGMQRVHRITLKMGSDVVRERIEQDARSEGRLGPGHADP